MSKTGTVATPSPILFSAPSTAVRDLPLVSRNSPCELSLITPTTRHETRALSPLRKPTRRTGLTTLFHEFVTHSLNIFPDLQWLIFAGPNQEWTTEHPRVEVCRQFPANDDLKRRLWADHFLVPAEARRRRADALVTTGFVPIRKCLPTVMHVFSLQHLDRHNKVGFARGLYRTWIMKHSWPKADLVITNSKFAADQILGVHPHFRERLVQSYEGLQHEQFHPNAGPDEQTRVANKFGIRPGYLLWISNFYPYKQAELLIAGYAKLSPELRAQHPLVMVGGNWEGALERAKEQASALGIEKDIHFLGWVQDDWLASLYRQSRAFCLASREETFGRCVIEAMACGVPCVVNDIPVMREVTDGQALLIDYKSAEAVTKALASLCEQSPLREKLIAGSLRRAAHFTFERLATERINAIAQLLAKRSR